MDEKGHPCVERELMGEGSPQAPIGQIEVNLQEAGNSALEQEEGPVLITHAFICLANSVSGSDPDADTTGRRQKALLPYSRQTSDQAHTAKGSQQLIGDSHLIGTRWKRFHFCAGRGSFPTGRGSFLPNTKPSPPARFESSPGKLSIETPLSCLMQSPSSYLGARLGLEAAVRAGVCMGLP